MNFLAIDGGVYKCAVASFYAGRLAWVGFVPIPPAEWHGDLPDRVIVERPIIRGNNTPDPQTIVDLAWSSAALAYSLGRPVTAVTPQQWKGDVPKPIHHGRVLLPTSPEALFSPLELAVLESAVPGWRDRVLKAQMKLAKNRALTGAKAYGTWEGHNLLDAVALGVWARASAFKETT